ncbi:PTS sugar transporter subunit IIA [Endozoicomonas numazuensis]|uniref:PTS fructose transporter subunit IIA n=1 Tax=Endozoicomonas numazuensis TaxID=1137799 RepID=A0A081NKU1_9GAMM|nr:PTS sugar transporter subunit IIA [Endozoicomonas numazuensis]KEQ19064.1 PTS fructose transporter subunit IIA [Endozoicomonas numazuensis]
MIIENILTPGRTLCGVQGASKKKVLETIAEIISEHVPAINTKDLFNSLINRERLGTTGLGKGIALPHCRSSACQHPTGLLIKLSEPIDFDSVDKQPVDLVFALIVPEENTQEHLNILQALAERFHSEVLLSQMRAAETPQALYSIICRPV